MRLFFKKRLRFPFGRISFEEFSLGRISDRAFLLRTPFSLSLFSALIFTLLFTLVFASSSLQGEEAPRPWKATKREDVARVWSGNPVGFAFVQHCDFLFIAFYDGQDKQLVLGQKSLVSPDSPWTFQKLPTAIGWDSHNYVVLAFDSDNILHVSGNMHAVPLVYFRATKPLDIHSVEGIHRMISVDTTREALQNGRENRCTYPKFLKNASGELIFTYRDGSSGNGSQIWNIYDVKTQSWRRFFDVPMFDGEGECNAYFLGPKQGPDGWFHIAWVWRDTPDCATNHDLSYIRSRDLVHWEQSDGTPQILPVTRSNSEVIAPLKNGEGLLNSHIRMGFDTEKRVVVTYTRYDENKNNQLMQARLEKDGWKYFQTTDWTHSWVFSGNGCIPSELSFGEIQTVNGRIQQYWNRKDEKSGAFILDPATLKPLERAPASSPLPPECSKCENPQENQRLKRFSVMDEKNPDRMFLFAWETLPVNRDRPHDVVPEPSILRMFILER